MLTLPDGRKRRFSTFRNTISTGRRTTNSRSRAKFPLAAPLPTLPIYDNTLKNRYNPAPDKEVYWSEQSWDEMFLPYIAYTIDSETPRNVATQPSGQQR